MAGSIPLDKKSLNDRFVEVVKGYRSAVKATRSVHDKRDVIVGQIQALEAKLAPVNAEIEKVEAPVRELQSEMAMISRALGGQVPIVPE
jgi:prefoldin subunit 5